MPAAKEEEEDEEEEEEGEEEEEEIALPRIHLQIKGHSQRGV